MIKKGFSYIGIFFLYILALLPLRVLYGISTLLYGLIYHVLGYRKRVVRENLTNSFPEKTQAEIRLIEKKFYKYFCDLVVEIVKMPLLSKKELQQRYTFRNIDLFTKKLDKGESVIVCSAHYGNWEWGMLALGLELASPRYIIYKPLNNEVFDQWFYRMRARFGNTPVSMQQTLRSVVNSKQETSAFFFASDQTPVRNPSNHWLEFLHQPTVVFSGPEKIARQTNRPVYYLNVTVTGRGYYEVDCIEIAASPNACLPHQITATQFQLLEQNIKSVPQYWLWSHKRWKHKPENITNGT